MLNTMYYKWGNGIPIPSAIRAIRERIDVTYKAILKDRYLKVPFGGLRGQKK